MSPFPQHYLSFSPQIPPLVGQSRLGAIPTTGPHEVATRTEFVTYPSPIPSMATADDGTRELPVGIWEPGDTEPIGPLVVFSHGANGTMYNNESLFRELASHGYRVASVAHSKHTMFTRLSDGTIVTPRQAVPGRALDIQKSDDIQMSVDLQKDWIELRLADLDAVLDQLPHDEVVAMGHSLGGASALALGRERDDVVDVVALECITVAGEGEGPYPVPILYFYSDVAKDMLEGPAHTEVALPDGPEDRVVYLPGSGHLGMTDLGRVTPIVTNLLDRGLDTTDSEVTLGAINEEVLAFLDQLQ